MGRILGGWMAAALALVAGTMRPLSAQMDMAAQHPMQMDSGPLGIPETRMGSGTSWLPDASLMHDAHFMHGEWTLMVHGNAFLQYDRQGGPRGDNQLDLLDWAMLAASRDLGGGRFELRGMFSTDPWGVGGGGYPLLLQTGETYRGVPIHDHQHPHDLFMELAALYERPIARNLGVSLYVAPAGEPALGPVAFPHRPSAGNDPMAPLAHHWQDGTHITFGVVTAGLFTRTVKLEASLFNGREPDENRANLDYAGRSLDSYSMRVTVNPDMHWSWSAWYGYLKSPEGLNPGESLHRFGAAALRTATFGSRGQWATALIYGANKHSTGQQSSSIVLESNLDFDGRNAVFGRAEYVQKSAEELVVPSAPPTTEYNIAAVALGYVRTVGTGAGLSAALGVRGSVNFVPSSLDALYGSRTPVGGAVYLRLRPAAGHKPVMKKPDMPGMPGMHGDPHN
jgi:hypothetical protein